MYNSGRLKTKERYAAQMWNRWSVGSLLGHARRRRALCRGGGDLTSFARRRVSTIG